jgi:hypothetical protein
MPLGYVHFWGKDLQKSKGTMPPGYAHIWGKVRQKPNGIVPLENVNIWDKGKAASVIKRCAVDPPH